MSTPLLKRAAWTSTPAASPGPLTDPDGLAVHWMGPAVPVSVYQGDKAAVARFLEAIRRFHVVTRGWSDIAYQFGVDTKGRRWELRGWARRSAANGDTLPNAHYGAVVAIIGQGQRPTPELLDGLADARAHFRRRHPGGTKLLTHNQVRPDPTECPGPSLTSWVHHGGPRPTMPDPIPPGPPPDPDPQPSEEDDTMTIVVSPNGSRFHLTSKGLVWLPAAVELQGLTPTTVRCDEETWQRYAGAFPRLKP